MSTQLKRLSEFTVNVKHPYVKEKYDVIAYTDYLWKQIKEGYKFSYHDFQEPELNIVIQWGKWLVNPTTGKPLTQKEVEKFYVEVLCKVRDMPDKEYDHVLDDAAPRSGTTDIGGGKCMSVSAIYTRWGVQRMVDFFKFRIFNCLTIEDLETIEKQIIICPNIHLIRKETLLFLIDYEANLLPY